MLDAERAINSIQSPNGDKIVDPVVINDTFAMYYKTLYESERSELEEEQSPFLNQLPIPHHILARQVMDGPNTRKSGNFRGYKSHERRENGRSGWTPN